MTATVRTPSTGRDTLVTVRITRWGTRRWPTSVPPSRTHCIPGFRGSHWLAFAVGESNLLGSNGAWAALFVCELFGLAAPPHPDTSTPAQAVAATAIACRNEDLNMEDALDAGLGAWGVAEDARRHHSGVAVDLQRG